MAQRSKRSAKKSAKKSANRRGRPFTGADDPRRARGPKKGAPNAGRPPDEIRRICREGFADRIPALTAIANGEAIKSEKVEVEGKPAELRTVYPTPEQRMKAIDMLAKYGLGTTFTPMDGDGNALARFSLTISGEAEGDE